MLSSGVVQLAITFGSNFSIESITRQAPLAFGFDTIKPWVGRWPHECSISLFKSIDYVLLS